ncbi:UNVERIFIED_ORG: hypothetical protein M2154_000762 [Enterobacter sp. JUb101]|nr:hypothetical protein [Lelliottia amnigena]
MPEVQRLVYMLIFNYGEGAFSDYLGCAFYLQDFKGGRKDI